MSTLRFASGRRQRLRGDLKASVSEGLLREFAREGLKAMRMSAGYLQALRVVLGNQAHAERGRYSLELNLRTDFATERVMRTIVDQMKATGITASLPVYLGRGHAQVVQVFTPPAFRGWSRVDLCTVLRREEALLEASYPHPRPAAVLPTNLAGLDVPY